MQWKVEPYGADGCVIHVRSSDGHERVRIVTGEQGKEMLRAYTKHEMLNRWFGRGVEK